MTAIKVPFRKLISTLLLAALTALSLAACHYKQVAKAAAVVPAPKKDSDELSRDLPADLYKNMPIFPGAQVEHVRKPRGAMREILFKLKDSPSLNQMVSFYKEGLRNADFKVTSSLIMPARKTWSCDFHKEGRTGSVALYPSDNDKTSTTIDLIYEMPSNVDVSLLEPKEDFDVIGSGEPGVATPVAQANSQDQAKPNIKAKRN